MEAFVDNIEQRTLENIDFRHVIYTGPHLQLVLMSLLPHEEIGEEVHEREDQFIRVEKGSAKAILGDVAHELTDGMAIVVPAGMKHNIINSSPNQSLKLYTIYCEKHHAPGTVHATKAEADAAEAHE